MSDERLQTGVPGTDEKRAAYTVFSPSEVELEEIAREIVRAHGGDLSVRPVDGTTIFETTLPREARPIETEVLTPP